MQLHKDVWTPANGGGGALFCKGLSTAAQRLMPGRGYAVSGLLSAIYAIRAIRSADRTLL